MHATPDRGAVMDVVVWLRSLGLEEYEAAFRENKINERVLPSLTQEDLKEIGVGPVGHRRILLDAIAALRADASGKAPPLTQRPRQRAERLSRRPRRAPPSDGDVLRLGRLNGALGSHGP